MSGLISRTDEMLILLNRVATSNDESSEPMLPDLGVTARRDSFSHKRSKNDLQQTAIEVDGTSARRTVLQERLLVGGK